MPLPMETREDEVLHIQNAKQICDKQQKTKENKQIILRKKITFASRSCQLAVIFHSVSIFSTYGIYNDQT